jgi:O-antigen/teichoic acid export membrane protein
MRGAGATALGPIIAAIVQLGMVPLLLHVWGAAKYGDWLLLSAVPSYLTLSDLGFGNASGSDMCIRVAADDRMGALQTFQSSWVLVTSVSCLTLLLAFLCVWRIPWQQWLNLSSVSNMQAATIMMVLGAQVVISQQINVAESAYRSDGNFATGTFWLGMLRLAEAVTATTIAVLGGNLLAVACAYLIVRCVGTVGYILKLRHLSPWIRYGIRYARLKTVRQLAAPAVGFMTMPVGYALNQQVLLIVIGGRLGSVAVAAFSTLRTLSRVSSQLINTTKLALLPELSRAFGEGNISLARRLHRHACRASLGLSVLGGMFLWLVGPTIYRLWIRQGILFDATCFHVLLLVAVTNSLWDTSSVLPMSINAHLRIAVAYSATALLSVGLAWILIPHLGIAGAAIALVATDGCMTGFVLRTSLYHVQDKFKDFIASLFVIPRFWQTLPTAPKA